MTPLVTTKQAPPAIYILTMRDVIRSVSDRWHATYADHFGTDWTFHDGTTPAENAEKLAELDLDKCSRDDVAAVLNESWVQNECDICCTVNAASVVVFEKQHEWSNGESISVCVPCFSKASEAFSRTPKGDE